MHSAEKMLQTHPMESPGDVSHLIHCIEECFNCAQACTSCADACLGEDAVQDLTRCIRLNLDCADICIATGKIMSRLTDADWSLSKAQAEICAEACRKCAEECQLHAGNHDHCGVCAESCRRCAEACEAMAKSATVTA